jgi:DNA-binding transcriptional ArsR family regulator
METQIEHVRNDKDDKVKVIEEPEKIQIMLEETRRTILTVLGNGIEDIEGKKRYSMSVAEITTQLNALNPVSHGKPRFKQTAIYHHIEILKEAEFISIDHSLSGTTTFYCRTAPVFVGSTVLASSTESINTEEPLWEGLRLKSRKMLKSFEIDLSNDDKEKQFDILMNLYSKKTLLLNRTIANDIKHLDKDKAIEVFRLIWFFWACSDPEMVDIAKKVKNFLNSEKSSEK